MLHLEKFSKKSWRAISSRNQMWRGVESEEKDAPEWRGVESEEEDALEWRGFRDRVDFHLGAIEQLTKERGRERNKQKSTNNINI